MSVCLCHVFFTGLFHIPTQFSTHLSTQEGRQKEKADAAQDKNTNEELMRRIELNWAAIAELGLESLPAFFMTEPVKPPELDNYVYGEDERDERG